MTHQNHEDSTGPRSSGFRELPLAEPPQFQRALTMASAARTLDGENTSAGGSQTSLETGLADRFGRTINYLRLSVTDRCNLRCEYCVPVSKQLFLPQPALLRVDEIVSIVRTMARYGLKKVRLTGGEPTIRPGIVDLIGRLREIPGIRKLCLTTNGLLLESMGRELVAAGVHHFNISIDTLDPLRFKELTRGGDLKRVWRGLRHLIELDTLSLKVNAVLMRGVNDEEIDAFLDIPLRYPIEVRFIELMPLAHCGEIHDDRYVPTSRVLDALRRRGAAPLSDRGVMDGPATRYQLPGALAPVGVISPVSETHFCDTCNRVRLSADGQLKLCLFGSEAVDLRAAVRDREPETALREALQMAMSLKPEKMAGYSGFTMMGIGG